jgi:dTDP-4-amino-4,6-dideoxygalactose transaminase
MKLRVPFYRADIREPEIEEVVATLRSGWLTTGPRVKRFEDAFASAVGASHAVAVNSCTAALHLAVRSLGLEPGQGVLLPSLTFAATAEVVRYEGGVPVLVDCDPETLCMDLRDAARKLIELQSGRMVAGLPPGLDIVGMIPVHYGGLMMDIDEIHAFASRHNLWVVEDAAHAFPAAWRRSPLEPWQRCGQHTARISCFSFYANKTITTGEGGMAVTDEPTLADRMRLLSLHGLSHDAWSRYSGTGSWDYRIVAPGYKYNLTDIAAALGICQLARAEEMRSARQSIALEYHDKLARVDEIELIPINTDRIHAWHLFPIRLRLDGLDMDRNRFIRELHERGVACSVHWRPLHLHPYYEETFRWQPTDLPVASREWLQLISLPIFSAMRPEETDAVVNAVREICAACSRHRTVATG